jgi:hypothetical protein
MTNALSRQERAKAFLMAANKGVRDMARSYIVMNEAQRSCAWQVRRIVCHILSPY